MFHGTLFTLHSSLHITHLSSYYTALFTLHSSLHITQLSSHYTRTRSRTRTRTRTPSQQFTLQGDQRIISFEFCGRKRSWLELMCCAVLCCAVLCCVVLCCAVLYCIDNSLGRLKKININRSQDHQLRDRGLNPGSECGYSTATTTVVSDYCAIIQKNLQNDLHLNCIQISERSVTNSSRLQTAVGYKQQSVTNSSRLTLRQKTVAGLKAISTRTQ